MKTPLEDVSESGMYMNKEREGERSIRMIDSFVYIKVHLIQYIY